VITTGYYAYFSRSIKYFLGAAVGTLAVLSLWPWYLKHLETKDASLSLASIKAAGHAIKAYEEDWRKLPPRNSWVRSSQSYGGVTQDPTYLRLTGINQPENPGWGINSRINLSIGDPERLRKNIASTDFPDDAVLLAPSYEQEVFPQRNGELPLQPLSSKDSSPTQHGLRLGATRHHIGLSGLYFLNDGSVKQLSLEKAAEALRIRPIPPSRRAEVEKKISYTNEVPWELSQEAQSKDGKIVLKRGEITTPLIPYNKKRLSINITTQAESTLNFLLKIEYFNKYKFPVNVRLKDGKLPVEAKITEIYSGTRDLETDKPISTKRGDKIGFNPSHGFADPMTTTLTKSFRSTNENWKTSIIPVEANFARGTIITWARDLSQEVKEVTGTTPKSTRILIDPKNVPEETAFISIRIKNNISAPLTIDSVKVSRN
jgi:hypothetical protein